MGDREKASLQFKFPKAFSDAGVKDELDDRPKNGPVL